MKRNTGSKLLALALCASLGTTPIMAAADDIDIFTGASAGTNVNPRILIVLDNTSNWSRQSQKWPGGLTQGQSEASAIKSVLTDLDGTVSLGLMEFVTGGNANDDGGFIRSAVRPMTTANKTSFSTQLDMIYNNITSPDEKRNSNTPYGNLMYDAYNYFAGELSLNPSADAGQQGRHGRLYQRLHPLRQPAHRRQHLRAQLRHLHRQPEPERADFRQRRQQRRPRRADQQPFRRAARCCRSASSACPTSAASRSSPIPPSAPPPPATPRPPPPPPASRRSPATAPTTPMAARSGRCRRMPARSPARPAPAPTP